MKNKNIFLIVLFFIILIIALTLVLVNGKNKNIVNEPYQSNVQEMKQYELNIEEEIKKGVFIFSKSEYKTSKRITLSRQNADDGYKSGAIEYSADGGHTWIPLTEKCIGRQLIINTSKKVRFHVYEKYKNLFDIKEV